MKTIIKDVVKQALRKATKNKAIRLENLCVMLSQRPQALRGAINELRTIGVPVVVGPNGYYLEKDREVVLRYANSLMLKAKGIMRAVNGLKKYAKFK